MKCEGCGDISVGGVCRDCHDREICAVEAVGAKGLASIQEEKASAGARLEELQKELWSRFTEEERGEFERRAVAVRRADPPPTLGRSPHT